MKRSGADADREGGARFVNGPFGSGFSCVRFDDRNGFSLLPLEGQPPQNLTAPASMVLADPHLKAVVDDFKTKLQGLQSPDQDQDQLLFKHQDEIVVSDIERLKRTQSYVKLLVRDFQLHAIPLGKRLKQRELVVEKRVLKIEKTVKEFEAKYFQKPLVNKEAESADKFAAMSKKTVPELDETLAVVREEMTAVKQRVYGMACASCVVSNVDKYLPKSVKIDEQSLADLQQALQQQREAIAELGGVLNRVSRGDSQLNREKIDARGGKWHQYQMVNRHVFRQMQNQI